MKPLCAICFFSCLIGLTNRRIWKKIRGLNEAYILGKPVLKRLPKGRKTKSPIARAVCTSGALEGNRTHDPLIRSQILYPAELRAHDEVPVGFEPAVKDLQSSALPTWLWNQDKILSKFIDLVKKIIW